MAIYNTSSDASNSAVRAFLTKVGEHYLGHSYNTGSGNGKQIWESIKEDFNHTCAYCGESAEKLQIEHLVMFNRKEYGIHHPGNTVPCCKECNQRTRHADKSYADWEHHLREVCSNRGQKALFETRKNRILDNFKKHNYPDLTDNEKHSIRVIAESLYENIKAELSKSLELYKKLDSAFSKPSP